MPNGLLVGALRAQVCLKSLRFLPARPAYLERVHISRTRSKVRVQSAFEYELRYLPPMMIGVVVADHMVGASFES